MESARGALGSASIEPTWRLARNSTLVRRRTLMYDARVECQKKEESQIWHLY
jgi:hypothetical protein